MWQPLNSRFSRSRLMHWVNPDDKPNYEKHWNDDETKAILIRNGFTPDVEIEYHIDNYALRNKSDACIDGSLLALGCSFTFGVGLDAQDIWPTLLANRIDMPVFNGGVPGSSADTAFRILNTFLKDHRPSAVVCLVPFMNRWEFMLNDRYEMFGPWHFDDEHLHDSRMLNEIHMNEERCTLNELKNVLAMTQLCEQHDIPFIHMDLVSNPVIFKTEEYDLARDLEHQGKKWHTSISVKLHKLYIDKYLT